MIAQSEVVEETLKEFFKKRSSRDETWKLRSNENKAASSRARSS